MRRADPSSPTSGRGRRADPTRSTRWLVVTQVGQFALVGLVAVVVVGLATSIASRRIGEREAIADARTATVLKAKGLVEPAIAPGLLEGDPEAIAALDDLVEAEVLDGDLVRVKVWSADGRILYSDADGLVGEDYELGSEEAEALETGAIEAEVSALAAPENRYERALGTKLLEVYLPITGPDGEPLLFEAYFEYDAVQSRGWLLWRSFAPFTLGALLLLELVQIPLAWSLARRLRVRLEEREQLLQRALDASDVERRQIASDLHDGVVQDLAGVAYGLSARARTETDAAESAALEEAADTVRESVRALRSLVLDLSPPTLREEGLEPALRDLLDRAAPHGVQTRLDLDDLTDPLPVEVAALLHRAAQEGIRNALRHGQAETIVVRVATVGREAVVEVRDDGQGFDPATLADREAEGHVGLRALRGLVHDAGGSVEVTSSPGAGTTLSVEVPLP